MTGAQQVQGIANDLISEYLQSFGLDLKDFVILQFDSRDEVSGEQAIRCLVHAQRQKRMVGIVVNFESFSGSYCALTMYE